MACVTRSSLGEHRRVLREAFARHRGVEVDTQGDAFFVAFARASDAIAAASDGQGVETAPNLTGVRAGRHDCYDRLVLDLRGGSSAGFHVSYVDAVYTDASGALVPLRGGAPLQIVVHAASFDVNGQRTYRRPTPSELANVAGYQTFRQVAFAGSFEGQTTLGLGVRARLPVRAFVLAGPATAPAWWWT